MRGSHVLKIVAYASPPISPTPGWRQYDFFVNGQSFFNFPKVYRLGLASGAPAAKNQARLAESGQRQKGPPQSDIAKLEAPTNQQEEQAYLQAAIQESMRDVTQMKAPANASADYGDLLDFGGGDVSLDPVHGDSLNTGAPPALPPSTTGYPQAQGTSNPYGTGPYGAPPPPQGAPGQFAALPAPAPPAGGDFAFAAAPVAPQPNTTGYGAPGAPPPVDTQQYPGSAPPQQVTPHGQPTPSSIGFASPPADFSGFSPQPVPAPVAEAPSGTTEEAPAPEAAPAGQNLTMNSLSGQEGLLGDGKNSQASGSLADQAYARIAMMDSFTLGAKPNAQNPFSAPVNVNDKVGGNVTLADIQSKKDPTEKKEVMKTTPGGAMVLSGTQNGNWGGQYGQQAMGGPPPLGQQPQMMGGPPPLGQQPQMMGGSPPFGQLPQMPQMMGGPPPLGQQPQMMGGPPPLGQPQMGMLPQMGAPQQPSPYGQPQMGMQQMYGQQPQMGQPGQYPPPLQQQPFGGAYGQPPSN